jgi:hypothetical protein
MCQLHVQRAGLTVAATSEARTVSRAPTIAERGPTYGLRTLRKPRSMTVYSDAQQMQQHEEHNEGDDGEQHVTT